MQTGKKHLTKMKQPTIMMALVLLSVSCYSQTKSVKQSKLFFTSYIGIANAIGDIKSNVSNGFQAMTGIEYKLNKHSSICGEINFDTYSYVKNGSTYKLDGTLNTIPLTVYYKHYLNQKKIRPYFKLGAGVANISKPIIEQKTGFTNIKNESAFTGQYQASIGLNYNLKPDYIFFIEAGYQGFSNTSLLNNQFSNAAIRVGLSTAL